MNKSNKLLQRTYNKLKKNIKKLNKTSKNKPSLKKCESFCKKDYMVEMNKLFKKYDKNYKPTKQENEFSYNTCKKTFCNENCIGYDFFGNKQEELRFQKKIKNGFQKTYSRDRVEGLKKEVLYLVVLM
jgi:hypothetical protein